MAVKIKTNDYGDCIYSEEDAIELIYTNPNIDITKIFFEDTEQYSKSLKELGINLPKINSIPEHNESISDFDKKNISNWHMPQEYYDLDVKTFLLEKCTTQEEKDRVEVEYELFERKEFIKVLQFLIYFVNTLRKHNMVWGVGRGSSVASFCLFLIGVHKLNPIQYNIDYKEFLR